MSESGTGLDVLVNNAGIAGRLAAPTDTVPTDFLPVFGVNLLGPVRVTHAFLPLLTQSVSPRLVMVSSGMGSFGVTTDSTRIESTLHGLVYPSSKAALNMVTTMYAKHFRIFASWLSTPVTRRPHSTASPAPNRSKKAPLRSSRHAPHLHQRECSSTVAVRCRGDPAGEIALQCRRDNLDELSRGQRRQGLECQDVTHEHHPRHLGRYQLGPQPTSALRLIDPAQQRFERHLEQECSDQSALATADLGSEHRHRRIAVRGLPYSDQGGGKCVTEVRDGVSYTGARTSLGSTGSAMDAVNNSIFVPK